jgi:hypothetical protein
VRADALDIDADGLLLLRRELQQGLASGEPVRWSPEAIKAEGRVLLQASTAAKSLPSIRAGKAARRFGNC